ncbi:hypothetical protein RHGRI_037406 [Rhododendron griersonianum]|uniref:Uncharacterized protein n=1 Tax=Rhododendron griersonianum TaxID=479676 RepID=A0AAV6HVA5_9ERIC|nr:hypothetical protein RHGRI_037406 [Rhododendron griersonianum]
MEERFDAMAGTEVVGFNERLEALKVESKPLCLEKSKYKRGHFVEDNESLLILKTHINHGIYIAITLEDVAMVK